MLRLTALPRFWTLLPSTCNLANGKAPSPTLVYIYKDANDSLGQLEVLSHLAQSQRVHMYKQHLSQVPPQILCNLKITSIPTIVGLLWGKPIAVITLANVQACGTLLKLLQYNNNNKPCDEAALASLKSLDNSYASLQELHAQYKTLEEIYKDPLVKLHGPSESHKDTLDNIKRQFGYNKDNDDDNTMANILQDIACKEALQKNWPGALEACIHYCRTFKQIPKIAHKLARILPTNFAVELLSEAKMLDTNIVHATRAPGRPLGGVAVKRRGFRGKYKWHGPDYRPKRYKPKDFHLYKNEWQCYQDKNLPLNNSD